MRRRRSPSVHVSGDFARRTSIPGRPNLEDELSLTDQPAGRFETESTFALSCFWVGVLAPAAPGVMVRDTGRANARVTMIRLSTDASLVDIRVVSPGIRLV